MSAEFTVKSADMLHALETLVPLFPTGQKSMPVGMYVKNGKLTIVCLSGSVYQADVDIDNYTLDYEATILYHDITPLLHMSGEMFIEFSQVGMSIKSDDVDCNFTFGYSMVAKQNFDNYIFRGINSDNYYTGLHDILNLGLTKLYNIPTPIILMDNYALQKFPNTWVQTRTPNLGLRTMLDQEHVRLLLRFKPTGVCSTSNNTLVFRNSYAYLQIPCKPLTDDKLITSLMEQLGEPTQLELRSYTDKVRLASRLNTKATCSVAVHKSGLKTTVSYESSSVSVIAGNLESEVLKVFKLPVQVWLAFLKVLDSNTIQILIGGEKICLRTQAIIIVTRALH